MMGCSGRHSLRIFERGTTKPFYNATISFSIPKALQNFRNLFVCGECLEDMLGQMLLRLKFLDLPDELFLRMLDMNFVNTLGGFYS